MDTFDSRLSTQLDNYSALRKKAPKYVVTIAVSIEQKTVNAISFMPTIWRVDWVRCGKHGREEMPGYRHRNNIT